MKNNIILIAAIVFIGCSKEQNPIQNEFRIDNATIVKNDELNHFIERIEFTIIDTTQIYCTRINKIISDDSLLIILIGRERRQIIITNCNGLIKGNIDYLGQGPGEYKQITDFTYNYKAKEIIVYDIVSKSLYGYNLEGQFLWQKKIDLQAVNIITDDQYYYFYTKKLISGIGLGKEIVVLDKNLKIVNSFFSYTEQPIRFRYSAENVFSRNMNNEILFSNVFRDTTYKISAKRIDAYYTYSISEEIPKRFTTDSDLYNTNFRNYVYNKGRFALTNNCTFFNIIRKGYSKDFYIVGKKQNMIETLSSQISKNIFLNYPIGSDNNYFYYSLLPSWLEGHVDEFYELLKRYNRSDLITYFNKDILNFNPVIIRIKFNN